MEEAPIEEEDIFDTLQKEEKNRQPKEKAPSFFKKKKTEEEVKQPEPKKEEKVEEKEQKNGREVDSSVEYKPFDRKTGRVTTRVKQYEQIEDEDCF